MSWVVAAVLLVFGGIYLTIGYLIVYLGYHLTCDGEDVEGRAFGMLILVWPAVVVTFFAAGTIIMASKVLHMIIWGKR